MTDPHDSDFAEIQLERAVAQIDAQVVAGIAFALVLVVVLVAGLLA